MIDSRAERQFYDSQYGQFLTLPDHALRIDRRILEANIENPAHPFYERRLLYRAAMRALEADPARGCRVLDYGCGPADFGLWLATEGADVTLLDLTPAAIELALRRAPGLPLSASAGLPPMPAAWICCATENSIWCLRARLCIIR